MHGVRGVHCLKHLTHLLKRVELDQEMHPVEIVSLLAWLDPSSVCFPHLFVCYRCSSLQDVFFNLLHFSCFWERHSDKRFSFSLLQGFKIISTQGLNTLSFGAAMGAGLTSAMSMNQELECCCHYPSMSSGNWWKNTSFPFFKADKCPTGHCHRHSLRHSFSTDFAWHSCQLSIAGPAR